MLSEEEILRAYSALKSSYSDILKNPQVQQQRARACPEGNDKAFYIGYASAMNSAMSMYSGVHPVADDPKAKQVFAALQALLVEAGRNLEQIVNAEQQQQNDEEGEED